MSSVTLSNHNVLAKAKLLILTHAPAENISLGIVHFSSFLCFSTLVEDGVYVG